MTEPSAADVLVIGGGAAGLFCAAVAGARGRRVVVLERNARVALKVLVSGGGRANFTNRHVGVDNYVSANPDFARSALARYTPQDFLALVERHGIAWHERRHGQLFCNESARQLAEALLAECAAAGVGIRCGTEVLGVESLERSAGTSTDTAGVHGPRFAVQTRPTPVEVVREAGAATAVAAPASPSSARASATGLWMAESVVVASGGLSWPRLGVSDVGYRIAEHFGLSLLPTRPGLVPLQWSRAERDRFGSLAGIAVPARVSCGRAEFEEAVLFTHGGLSGPAILQISNHWKPGLQLVLDFCPGRNLQAEFSRARSRGERGSVRRLLAEELPRRLVDALLAELPDGSSADRPLGQLSARELADAAAAVTAFTWLPGGAAGWDKAEVTLGGVDTRDLDSRRCEARAVPGLYFVGEVVDMTGWLGGFNFQWAWASAHAAGLSA